LFESKRSSPAASVLLRGNADNADYKWHLPGHAELEELGFAS
jgi:hypothetical protein